MTKLLSPKRWTSSIIILQVTVWMLTGNVGCSSGQSSTDEEVAAQSAQSPEDEISSGEAAEVAPQSNSASQDTSNQAAANAPPEDDSLTQELAGDELGGKPAPAVKKDPLGDLAIPENQKEAAASPPSKAEPVVPPVEKPAAPTEVNVTDLLYVSKKKGGTVVVETSAPATFHTREVAEQNQVILEIANARLPDRLKQPFLTQDFQQSINSISAYQEPGSSTVRIVVQFKGANRASVEQNGTRIELSPADSGADADGSAALADAIGDKGGASSASSPETDKPRSDSDARILPATSVDPAQYDNLKFYGRPISLEVRDTPVRDVINVIAEQSGANIIIGNDVDGNISLKLRKIPWDEALLVVMKTRGLGYVRQGSILRVAKYESLRLESSEALKVLEAHKAAEPLRVKIIPVSYAQAKDLVTQVGAFLSKERGKAVSDIRTNSLIITDVPEVLSRIGNLVKALDIPPLQVLIEGKVVEATEAFQRDIGFNWGATGLATQMGAQSITPTIGTNGANNSAGIAGLSLGTAGMGGATVNIGQFNFLGNITAALSLAETEGTAHIVSSPRVVAVNNEQATIVQGQNIAIQTTTISSGVPVTTTSYTPVEMKLDVTPQVTSENDVIMMIKIKRDFVAQRPAGSGAPDINHREASTRVLVRNGQTAVIGGVYQNDITDTENGIPGLRSIPIIGWLFKTKALTKQKNELLVFLTPRILNAESAGQKDGVM